MANGNFGWGNSPGNMPGGNGSYMGQNGGNGWSNQNPTPSFLPGRIVDMEERIKPQEIPMDGNPAVFLKSDGSIVWVKIWTSNGTISTSTYVLQTPNVSRNEPQDDAFQTAVFDRLDKIESMLKKNNRPYKPYNQKNQNNKREVTNHDESRK